MSKTALQLYSVKDEAEKDFPAVVRQVGRLGYEGVEFAGYYNTPAGQLSSLLEEAGLEAAGTHILLADIEENFDTHVSFCRSIDCTVIICPFIPRDERNNAGDWEKIAKRFNQIGRRLSDEGIRFFYHHHNFDFETYGKKRGIDIILEHTDQGCVGLELDAYWLEHAGINCIDFYLQHLERITSLHLKDMNNREEMRDTEIGNGVINIRALVKEAVRQHAEWLVIEQEKFDMPPMKSAEINSSNLKAMIQEANDGLS